MIWFTLTPSKVASSFSLMAPASTGTARTKKTAIKKTAIKMRGLFKPLSNCFPNIAFSG